MGKNDMLLIPTETLEVIMESLEEHDDRFDDIEKRLDKHDTKLDDIATIVKRIQTILLEKL